MSSTSEPTDLQFDRADFAQNAAPTPTCGLCQRPIETAYFEVNGHMTCAGCRDSLAHAHEQHVRPFGLMLALVAGLAAGVVGALLYYAVLALTGYEIGLIAIAVGFLVGGAVRWGSGTRGGPAYQAIAVAITYLAIVSTYAPFIFAAVTQPPESTTATATASTSAQSLEPASAPAATSAAPPPTDAPPPTGGEIAFAWAVLAGLIIASPFLAGFQNVIGWLIIGFALYEAWKVNRRVTLAIAGPFTIGSRS